MSDNKIYIKVGGPWLFLFFLLVFTFKVTHVITWPWVWVLAPLWAPIALVVLITFLVAIVSGLDKPKRRF